MSTSSATTAVPAASLTPAGFVIPTETNILAGVQSDINAALGGSANQDLDTPQGQLAMSETAIIGDCNDQLLALMNGFDPRNATGRIQDALGYIFLMTRKTGETRSEFETRRQDTIEANSNGTNAAVLGAILNITDVSDAYVIDNPTDDAETLSGVSVAARRMYVSVDTVGPSAEIGQAILLHKNPCSMMQGDTAITAQDTNSAYGGNGPTYTFYVNVAEPTPIYFNVSIANSTSVPSTALASIQTAILSIFNGETDSTTRARIAGEIFASQYYCSIASLGAWAKIVEITIGTSANPTDTTVQMTMAQLPTLTASNITLTLV